MFYALLVACDAYPPGAQPLAGCRNDVDAIQRMLFHSRAVGVDAENIRLTRLVAAQDAASANADAAPTRENLIAQLRHLAREVTPADPVLIYYSGHGARVRFDGSPTWREALVLTDGVDLAYLYDLELNALLNAIAARSLDLTVILDCCHSAGITRDVVARRGTDRFLATGRPLPRAPDPSLVHVPVTHPDTLNTFVTVAACDAVEVAGEGTAAGEPTRGIFTAALVRALSAFPNEQDRAVRWADIWPDLVADVDARCTALGRRAQHPRLSGDVSRRVFGGPCSPADTGLPVRRDGDQDYAIGAGRLLGISERCLLAVYPTEPARFPPLGSAADALCRLGTLEVVTAERDTALARAHGSPFHLPPDARARLVEVGLADRLRVRVGAEDAAARASLLRSDLFEVVDADTSSVDATLGGSADDGWTIGSDVQAVIAKVPPGHRAALVAGLEALAQFAAVLRMASRTQDPQLAGRLTVTLLDCRTDRTDSEPVQPELSRDDRGVYAISAGTPFAVRVSSTYGLPLRTIVLNCGAGGEVEYLGDVTLSTGDAQTVWFQGVIGSPFVANPDSSGGATDRLLAIAATRLDADLRYLHSPETVQDVVDRTPYVVRRGPLDGQRLRAGPPDLWTAVLCPLQINAAVP